MQSQPVNQNLLTNILKATVQTLSGTATAGTILVNVPMRVAGLFTKVLLFAAMMVTALGPNVCLPIKKQNMNLLSKKFQAPENPWQATGPTHLRFHPIPGKTNKVHGNTNPIHGKTHQRIQETEN